MKYDPCEEDEIIVETREYNYHSIRNEPELEPIQDHNKYYVTFLIINLMLMLNFSIFISIDCLVNQNIYKENGSYIFLRLIIALSIMVSIWYFIAIIIIMKNKINIKKYKKNICFKLNDCCAELASNLLCICLKFGITAIRHD